MRKASPPSHQGNVSKAEMIDSAQSLSVPRQLYDHALATRTSLSWNLFHLSGDILLTAENTIASRTNRSGQAAIRYRECASLRRSPRFSHVLLCVSPGLFIESTPASLVHSFDEPAVHAIRAEDYNKRGRSKFLVLRPYALFDSPEVTANFLQRCVFHHDRRYNFRPVSASHDRMRCSELVATIYGELGTQLVADLPYHETLPFDIEVALENSPAWLDVTELYVLAEKLSEERLIKVGYPDSRNMFFQQYASGVEITKLLNEWGGAADAVLKDIREQMTRPGVISPSERDPTYVTNVTELLSILRKYFALYIEAPRYAFSDATPQAFRFDGIKSDDLFGKLYGIEAELAKCAWQSIAAVRDAFIAECQRFVTTANQAEAVLAEEASEVVLMVALGALRKLIRAADDREPEAERGEGEKLVQDITAFTREIETFEASPTADPKIMKGFLLAAGMLNILARHTRGWFYGSAFLKLVQTSVSNEEGSLYDAEFRAALAATRQLMRDDLRGQRQLFMPWSAVDR